MGAATAQSRVEDAQALEGRVVGRYVLRFLVASGGMASVYLAQLAGHAGFEKWVALKRIHAHLASDPRFVAMFLDEARVSSRIHHPNVCSVLDFGEDEGTPYLVMEYLHGETLAQLARRAKDSDGLPVWLAARAIADAARGLHAAHELTDPKGESLGVVHRDVSPQNVVVLYDGTAKVLDFGVAKARGRLETTSTGEVKGKSAYFAPEQIQSAELDRRVDVWALGVVLWELLAQRRLFRGDSEAATLHKVLTAPIDPPSSAQPVPKELDAVTMRALSRDPKDRFATAGELADALESWLYTLGKPAGQAQIAEWMVAHFRDKKATREAMLRSEPVPGNVPTVDIDSRRTMPSDASRAVAKKRGSPVLAIAAGAAALVALTAVAMWAVMRPPADAPPAPATHAVTPSAPTRDVAPSPVRDPSPVAPSPARDPSPVVPAPAPPPPTPVQDVAPEPQQHPTPPVAATHGPVPHAARAPGRLNLMAIPAGEVFLGGRSLGQTPLLEVELPAGHHRLVVRGAGAPRTVDVSIRSGETTRASVR